MYTTEFPDTLDRDDIYWSDAAYKAREQRQARALDEFRLDVVNAKLRALKTLKARLLQGLPALEQQFLQEPTYLRAGSAEFITFRDTAIGSGEQTGYF